MTSVRGSGDTAFVVPGPTRRASRKKTMTDESAPEPRRPIPHHWVMKAMEALYGPLGERHDARPGVVADPKDNQRE